MGDAFFTEVPGRIPFGGLDSDDPLAFKVYEPDRMVLGKRMEDHLRIGVCLWHSFAWPGIDMFGAGTLDRPWLGRRPRPDGRRPREDGRRVRVPREARRAVLLLPRRRRRAGGRRPSPSSGPTSTRSPTTRSATRSGPASRCCGARPTCSPIRATRPARRPTRIPRCSPTPRRRSSTCSRSRSASAARTTSCGAVARATTRCSTPTSGARARSSPASCTSSPSTSTKIGFEGTLLIEPKPMEPTKHQYDYDAQTVHGFLVRNGLEGEYRVNIEANHATLAGHSFHHEVAYAVANGILGSIDANRGDPQNGWDTDQFPNSVEDLALPLYEILRERRLHDRRLQLRREAAPPEHRTGPTCSTPTSAGIDTLARALLVAADLVERGDAGRERRGALRGLGRRARDGDPRRHASRSSRSRRRSPRARSTRSAVVGRPGAAREPRQPADLGGRPATTAGADPMGVVLGHRRLDDRDQGRPGRRAGRGRRRSARRVRRSTSPQPALERAGPGAVVGRHRRRDPVGARRGRPGSRGTIDGDRADRPDARRSSCSTRPARSSGRRSCGTTSGRPPSATRSARPSAGSG